MAWAPRKPIVYDGVEYGLKDIEFWRIVDLPSRVGRVPGDRARRPGALRRDPRRRLAA